MMAWYYLKNGQQMGPVTASALRLLAHSGQMEKDDHVWREGLPSWVKAKQLKGLFNSDDRDFVTAEQSTSYTCTVCGRSYSVDEVYDREGLIICQTCFDGQSQVSASRVPQVPNPCQLKMGGAGDESQANAFRKRPPQPRGKSNSLEVRDIEGRWERRDAGTLGSVALNIALQPYWWLKVSFAIKSILDRRVQTRCEIVLQNEKAEDIYETFGGVFPVDPGQSRSHVETVYLEREIAILVDRIVIKAEIDKYM